MIVISESPNGKQRMVIETRTVQGKTKSFTQHQHLVNGDWIHKPNTQLSPWPAGRNFLTHPEQKKN